MTGRNSLRGNPRPALNMATIVQKYGGTSVADAEKIKGVARRIASACQRGDRVVAVVSAMGDTTDRLIELAGQVSSRPESRELDALLSTGEQMSCTLVAMALKSLGLDAVSLSGAQAGIRTDSRYGKARIAGVEAGRIQGEVGRWAGRCRRGLSGNHLRHGCHHPR